MKPDNNGWTDTAAKMKETKSKLLEIAKTIETRRSQKLAEEATRAEAHEDGAFAAEAVRQDYGDNFEGARDPAQRAYDAAWIATYAECREFYEVATAALFAAYDAQKHPASVTAAALADAALETLDPGNTRSIDPLIRQASRATLIRLAERILEACPAAREPN